MPAESRDRNFGLSPQEIVDLQEKTATLQAGLDVGDSEALRTMKQVQALSWLAQNRLEQK